MTIIAISDTHVGAPQANTEDLLWFLGDLSLRADEVTDLVLCGDILDFWRCDIMDMVFESADLMSRLIDLADNGVNVHYIAGNHDYIMRKAESKHERINFSTSLELFEDGRRWAFLHGWEFDKFMNPAYFDALCYTNTTHGDMIRKTFKSYLRFLAPVEAFLSAITGWRIKDEMTQMVASHDNQGLLENRAPIGDGLGSAKFLSAITGWRIKDEMTQMVASHDKQGLLENRAPIGDGLGSAKFPDGGLVFGHLHMPYLNPDEGMANCGSWHSGDGMNNTYIEIDGETVHLRRFEG